MLIKPKNNVIINKNIDINVQKQEFTKLFNIALSGIKISNTLFYTSHNLLTKASRIEIYKLLKNSEEKNQELSTSFYQVNAQVKNTHPSLEEYRQDIAQSFEELALVFAHRQNEAKYLADYINTGNLDSYKKAEEEISGTGSSLSNAVSRLIFGVGKKLNIDTNKMEEDYKKIDKEVKQEFETRFGK